MKGQLKDLKDVETWMRLVLPEMMREEMRVEVDVEKIIILGVGSGAHLALLTVCPVPSIVRSPLNNS